MLKSSKILPILELTSSDHDGEALAAIRKVNEILEASGMRWAQFFHYMQGTHSQITCSQTSDRPRRGHMAESEIGRIFDEIDDYSPLLSDNQSEWVERMRTAWEGSGSLSERQEEIITGIRDDLQEKADRRGGVS